MKTINLINKPVLLLMNTNFENISIYVDEDFGDLIEKIKKQLQSPDQFYNLYIPIIDKENNLISVIHNKNAKLLFKSLETYLNEANISSTENIDLTISKIAQNIPLDDTVVDKNSKLSEVLEIMRDRKVPIVSIVDNDKYQGYLTLDGINQKLSLIDE